MSAYKLSDILTDFLAGNQPPAYPPIEARILQLNPLQITDDGQNYFDINSKPQQIYRN